MAFATVTVDLGDGTKEFIGIDGGDGWTYFMERFMYRMANESKAVQKSVNYNDSQAWINVGSQSGSTGTLNPGVGNGSVAANADVEAFVQWCENIARDNSHGYDQANRNGPNYDCASLIWWGLHNAGFDVGTYAFNTDSMPSVLTAAGFRRVPKDVSTMQRGDILLKNGHTELYIGQQQRLGAHSNEFGGIVGGRTGDQTGDEISITPYYDTGWTSVWRYMG